MTRPAKDGSKTVYNMTRPVRFNVHTVPADTKNHISMVDMPAGHTGDGFFATKLSDAVGLARKNSMWPLPFATSCCGIEFMATMASHYDLARFGASASGFPQGNAICSW